MLAGLTAYSRGFYNAKNAQHQSALRVSRFQEPQNTLQHDRRRALSRKACRGLETPQMECRGRGRLAFEGWGTVMVKRLLKFLDECTIWFFRGLGVGFALGLFQLLEWF